MFRGRQRRRSALLLAVGVLATALALGAHAIDLLRSAELATVDARFDVRGAQEPAREVVLVGLDDRSIERIDEALPIRRRHHARVIERIADAGARVIAYDVEFTGPTSAPDDNALLEALRGAGGTVVLATTRIDADGRSDALGGAENRAFARAGVGSANFPPRTARGGVIRRLPYAEIGVPALAVEAARRAGARIDPSEFDGDGAWIDVPGPAGTIPAIPFVDVRDGKVPASRFRGRVVVVGATAPVLQDVKPTAAGEGVPGAEIHAAAIATLLRGVPLRDAGGGLSLLWLAIAGLLTPLAAIRLPGLRWLPVPLVLGILGAVVAQVAFAGGTILPVAAAALGLVTSAVGVLAVAYATDLRDRRRLRATFARFVPEAVVDEVAARAGKDLRLGGVRREGTVLFCDLRGFTTVAESLEPEAVITVLNAYLTEMSDAILDHGGTVVSFMGDGIMAVFGAPLPQDDHADRALAAAREMLGPRLARFHAGSGLATPPRLGVGICSGPVMSGNVGSPRRVEYTAVGDTTNTAARLEAMTKDAGVPILVADATRAALCDPDAAGLRDVGELPVRGRAEPVRVWTFGAPPTSR